MRETDGIERVVTAALIVQPRSRWKKGESVRTGWRAGRISVVEITDLDRVGAVLAQLVSAGAAIVGPSWEVRSDNDAHDEARRRAAEDST